MSTRICPFSGTSPIKDVLGYQNIQHVFNAPQVGGLYCTKQSFPDLVEEVNQLTEGEKIKLIALIQDLRQQGQEIPELTFDLIRQAKGS